MPWGWGHCNSSREWDQRKKSGLKLKPVKIAKDTHRNDKTPHKEKLKEETRKYNDR